MRRPWLAWSARKVRWICVDLEERLLAEVRRRAERAGATERIRLHRAEAGHLGLEEPVDFALAFWVVHEVRDQAAFLAQVRACLKPGGRLLIVEPRGEVGEAAFERTVAIAGATGLVATARPVVTWSRACLFEVPTPNRLAPSPPPPSLRDRHTVGLCERLA